MMTDNELDNLFKNTLGDHEVPVPADMWQRIQPGGSKKRPVIAWWKWTTIAAVLLVAGLAIWQYSGTPTSRNDIAIANNSDAGNNKDSKPAMQDNHTKNDAGTPSQQNDPADNAALNREDQANTATQNNRAADRNEHPVSALNINDKKKNNQPNNLNVINSGEQQRIASNNRNNVNKNGLNVSGNPFTSNTTTEQPQSITNDVTTENEKRAITNNSAATQTDATGNTNKNAVAANKQKDNKKTKLPWVIEFFASSAYADKQTYDIEKEETIGMAAPITQPQPKPSLWNYGAGVTIGVPLTKKLSIKTGLQFSQTRQKAGYQQQNVVDMMSINGTDTSFYRQIVYKTENHNSTYNAVNVPVLVAYQTGKKIQVGITAGAVVNAYSWYTGQVPNANYTATLDTKNTYKRNTGVALYTGITASKKVGSVEVFAEPHIQYSLSNMTRPNILFKQKINTYGLSVGIRTALHK